MWNHWERKNTGELATQQKFTKKWEKEHAQDVGVITMTVICVLQKEKNVWNVLKSDTLQPLCHSKAAVQEITEADEDDCMFLGSVEQEKNRSALLAEDEPPWRTSLTLAHTPVSFKIDSGADTSVMSEATYETLQNKPKLTAVTNTLQSPGGA